MALVQLFNPAVEIKTWHVFLIYLATLLLSVAWNILLAVRLPWVGTAFSTSSIMAPANNVVYFSSAVFLAIIISCAARAETYQSNAYVLCRAANNLSFVWTTYTNEIGWQSPFIVVVTGLINPAYCFLGLDSTVHIAEDSIRPARDVPLGLMFTVLTS
jgi:choline transport protein